MMLKHLGTFAILAVCLFAIAIVMGGGEMVERIGCCDETMQKKLRPVTPETDAPETDAPETDAPDGEDSGTDELESKRIKF